MDFQVVTTNLVLQGPVPENMQNILYWYAGKHLEASLQASGSNFATKLNHAPPNSPKCWFCLVFWMIFANGDMGGSAIKNCLEVVFAAPCFFFGVSSCKKCPRRCQKKVPGASRNAFFKRLTTNKIQSTEHQKPWFYLGVLIILDFKSNPVC